MKLVMIEGGQIGREVRIEAGELVIGRTQEVGLILIGANVSRRHARIWREGESTYIEDLGSSNGTFVNRQRIKGKVALSANDILGIGPYLLRFEDELDAGYEVTIQRQTLADRGNRELFRTNTAAKLQAVLELAHQLSGLLDADLILSHSADHLLRLFPHAARVMIIWPAAQDFTIRLQKERSPTLSVGPRFSRSLTKQVFEKGVALLAADTRELPANATLATLGIRSLMAAPLADRDRKVQGMVELDRFEFGNPFTDDDLYLLAAVALQVSTVLENATLHQRLLETHRIQQEIGLAREIQQSFLPQQPLCPAGAGFELLGRLTPAYEISGDYFDYFTIDADHLVVVVGDVSGKGMPAALFMTMVRALIRQLSETASSPAQILSRLNDALARDNPKFMFVTVLLGVYDIRTGQCQIARGGHPPALLRLRNGQVQELQTPTGTLVGILAPYPSQADVLVNLNQGDALIFYTDGVTEAVAPDSPELFGSGRLAEVVARFRPDESLEQWVQQVHDGIQSFSQSAALLDDVTLLMLRRI